MLQSALEHYQRQQRIAARGLVAARRARGDLRRLTAAVIRYQEAAAADAALAVGLMLAEQGINAEPVATVSAGAFAGTASDGRPLASLLALADAANFDLIVATQLRDAGRVAAGAALTIRPKAGGYVRMISPPCCPRCAVLAGKWFGWNSGFDRHPRCDCRHIPSQENRAGDLTTDPQLAFKRGEIRGLTKAETKALNEGADLGQVVNARRSRYMDAAGARFTREGTSRRGFARGIAARPTPEQIYRIAGDDRERAIALLKRFRYVL